MICRYDKLQGSTPLTYDLATKSSLEDFPNDLSGSSSSQLSGIDTFRHAIPPDDQAQLLKKLQELHSQRNRIPGQTPRIPDLDTMIKKCLVWINTCNEEDTVLNGSLIALLTSHPFACAVRGYVHDDTLANFQHFLLSTTLAYTNWRDHRRPPRRLSPHDLHRISRVAGSSLIRRLDRLLLPGSLRCAPKAALQALFIIAFGTILGVMYSTPAVASPEDVCDSPGEESEQRSTTWSAMKEQLARGLASRLVSIGSRMGLELDAGSEKRIVDGAMMWGWSPGAGWAWGNVMVPPGSNGWQSTPSWSTGQLESVEAPGGVFLSSPQATMVSCPEFRHPAFPRIDRSDGRKRRSMLVVGSSDGQQVYARLRASGPFDSPSLIV